MENKRSLNQFTNQFSSSKTLRFELKPVGKTLENIKTKGLLSQDEQRAESYKKMKTTIDGFHKYFIEIAMEQVKLTKLDEFADLYYLSSDAKKNDAKFEDKYQKVKDALRKEIAKGFNTGDAKEIFSKIGKKELITELLEDWISTQKGEDIYFDEKFKNFTTYFGGFHENRKNMYTDKEQSTAIAYRLIHENLPKFLDNIKTFEKVKAIPELRDKYLGLYMQIEEYLNISTIEDAFELDYFNETLTQKDIDVYNLIIGGKTESESKIKIQGLNEHINLYNQKQEKKNRIPKLKFLYKQILSDRENISFLPDAFEESQEVLDAIENYYKANLLDYRREGEEDTENVFLKIVELFAEIKNLNTGKIYIRNDKAITDISKSVFGDWSIIKSALEFTFVQTLKLSKKGLNSKQVKAIEDYLKQPYFSIEEIENALLNYKDENEILKEFDLENQPIANYFTTHFLAKKKTDSDKEFNLIANIEAKYSCIKGVLSTPYPDGEKLNQDQQTIDNIKAFLDGLMELLHFVKPLALPSDAILEKEEHFYSHFENYYNQLQLLIPLYNKVRNYATQKPYSTEKFKLNFENAQLLGGWDANKERDYLTSLLRKDGLYYLAIMDKHHNKVFQDIDKHQSGDCYEKMVYKLLPGVNKMLPKVFFAKSNIDYFAPSQELLDKYKAGTHKKGDNFSIKDCHNLIDFFKQSIDRHEDWNKFNFEFSDTNVYEDLSDFYREVSQQGYKLTFDKVSEEYVDTLVSQGKLYLFQIYNKDFSPYSKGKPNMHTLYWKALFDEENLKDVVYKLNGQAEMFYRKKSIREENKVVHKANEAIANKNPDAEKKHSTFEYDLIKDKRYTVDKFQFHVPITMNFKAEGTDYINASVLNYLKNNPDVNIIGLDRGERHLIYLSLINQKGEILQQFTLNEIINKHNGVTHKVNYHKLLDAKEKEREKARENWGAIENIKELKEGYISQVVHKIAQLMVEHNAIVVMEDLNFGFKRGRFKVEKQVYQKLEKMLIDKLNYLVFKDKLPTEAGGLYKALQLTNKFKSFKELGKQSGFLFYVPAWNTSKIDPTTGFVNLFNTKYESVEKAQVFFNTFKRISYNQDQNYFEFAFDYNDFTTRAEGTKADWTVCTAGERIITYRNAEKNNEWDNKTVNITQQFEALFERVGILYGGGSDLRETIAAQHEKSFFNELLHLFKLTLQMRNSITNSEVDYLISPVKNSKGEFYDSRKADASLPKDADANGAYHIAKKGLMWLGQINKHDDAWKKLDLDKSNKGWLNFVQQKR